MARSLYLNIAMRFHQLTFLLACLFWIFSSPGFAQDAATMEEKFKEKVTKIKAECDVKRAAVRGAERIKARLPGFSTQGNPPENIDLLPGQDERPNQEDIRAILESHSIKVECDERVMELMRPLVSLEELAFVEAMRNLASGQVIKMIMDNATYGDINLRRQSYKKAWEPKFSEIKRLAKLQTKGARFELGLLAKQAETELDKFLDQYDRDLTKRKEQGYTACQKVRIYEFCTRP